MQIHSRQSLEAIHGLLQPPHVTRDPIFPDLRRLWLRLLAGLGRRRMESRAFAQLSALDDRMLADIGVSRGDLNRVARVAPGDRRR